MASILTHYLVAKKYVEAYENYGEEETICFLVGAIAADTPNSLGKGYEEREASHFGSSPSMSLLEMGNFNLDGDVLEYDSFIDKYKNQLDNPFIKGYLLHLYTDKKWFKEIITDLLNRHASEIKDNAESAYDLSFKEAILWYTKNLYQTYNAHDILYKPYINFEQIKKMRDFDEEKCPIECINKGDLKKMLGDLEVKCEEVGNLDMPNEDNILISLESMFSFIDACATEMHNLYFKSYR